MYAQSEHSARHTRQTRTPEFEQLSRDPVQGGKHDKSTSGAQNQLTSPQVLKVSWTTRFYSTRISAA